MEIKARQKVPHEWLLLAGMALMCFNLRTAMTASDPLLKMIEKDVGISMEWSGAFALLPVAVLGIASIVSPKLSDYWSVWKVILIFELIGGLGVLWRSMDGLVGLYGGMVLLGIGCGVVGASLPGFIKLHFPLQAPMYMGFYTALLSLGISTASAISMPIAQSYGGWRVGLGIWSLPMLLSVLVWGLYFMVSKTFGNRSALKTNVLGMFKKKVAWDLSIFYISRIGAAYFLYTWLSILLQERGLSADDGGFVLATIILSGIPTSMFSNWLAIKIGGSGRLIMISAFAAATGCWLMFYLPTECVIASAVLLGLGSGAVFSRGFGLMVERAKDEISAIELSGMVQGTGFLIGAGVAFLCTNLVHVHQGYWVFCGIFTLFNIISMIYGKICAQDTDV